MFHVVLYQPEIAPNTGNIIRLCANTGVTLNLIHPLGFSLEAPRLRRAGLDYHQWACVKEHASLDDFLQAASQPRIFAFTTRAALAHTVPDYRRDDALLFGPETRGLPASILERIPAHQRLRIPMRSHNRSLNLSNAVAIACYEAWRQHGFAQAAPTPSANPLHGSG